MSDILDAILNPSPSEFKCLFEKTKIAVWIDAKELKLYVNGQSVDTAKVSLFPKRNVALLRGVIKEGENIHEIEVFGRSGILRPKIKICVNGQRISGDEF
jgi:hypothetical protein